MITRRGFLQSAGALAISGSVPSLFDRALAAQDAASQPASRPAPRRVLVVLTLAGGNDGLNTVIPFEDDRYFKARPTLAVKKAEARKIADTIGLHPSLRRMEASFKEGRLAVIQGVGYPAPNRSHFHSMDVWQSGDPELRDTRTGWLGRALDADPAARGNALYGFHVGDEAPRLLLSETQRITAFRSVQDYTLEPDRLAPAERKRIEEAFAKMYRSTSGEGGLGLARRAASQALSSAREMREVLRRSATQTNYPANGLAQQLKVAGQVIGAELPVHVVSINFGGFDTHANERPVHANLWAQIDEALAAFRDDLVQRKRADDVVVFAYSEFGRRVAENASGGTDHGAAAPAFLFGDAVKGGLHGAHPNLEKLEDGDVAFTTDFRRVYATLLDGWLGVSSARVLGGKFEPLDVLRA